MNLDGWIWRNILGPEHFKQFCDILKEMAASPVPPGMGYFLAHLYLDFKPCRFWHQREYLWHFSNCAVTSRFWIKGGQLGPHVCDITFLDQRWSVGTPRLWRHIFGSKGVSWDPASVTSHFWIKGGQLGPCVSDITFLVIKDPAWVENSVFKLWKLKYCWHTNPE